MKKRIWAAFLAAANDARVDDTDKLAHFEDCARADFGGNIKPISIGLGNGSDRLVKLDA